MDKEKAIQAIKKMLKSNDTILDYNFTSGSGYSTSSHKLKLGNVIFDLNMMEMKDDEDFWTKMGSIGGSMGSSGSNITISGNNIKISGNRVKSRSPKIETTFRVDIYYTDPRIRHDGKPTTMNIKSFNLEESEYKSLRKSIDEFSKRTISDVDGELSAYFRDSRLGEILEKND